jgi:hypothetical protein
MNKSSSVTNHIATENAIGRRITRMKSEKKKTSRSYSTESGKFNK